MPYLKKCLFLLILFPLPSLAAPSLEESQTHFEGKKRRTEEPREESRFLCLPQTIKEIICTSLDEKSLNSLYVTSKELEESVESYMCSIENTLEITQNGSFCFHIDQTTKKAKERPCPFFNLSTPGKIECIKNFITGKNSKTKKVQIDFPISETSQDLRLQIKEKKEIENHFNQNDFNKGIKVTGFFFCKEKQELFTNIENNNIQNIEALLDQEPDQTNIFYSEHKKPYIPISHKSPLALAVNKKNKLVIEKILQINNLAQENKLHYYNLKILTERPLEATLWSFDESITEMLLEKDPKSLFIQSHNKENIIHCCAHINNKSALEFFLLLFPDGAKRTTKTNYTALHYAVEKNQYENVIALLLSNPKAINQKNRYGTRPIDIALEIHKESSSDRAIETAKKIFKKIIQIDKKLIMEKDNHGNTLLHIAAKDNKAIEIIKLLLQANTDAANDKNSEGNTPLHIAANFNENIEIIKLLLQANTDAVNDKNNEGNTPLHIAVQYDDDIEVIKLLLQANPNAVNDKNNKGNTPFHSSPEVVLKKDNDGNNLLHLAVKNNYNIEIIKLLLEVNPVAAMQINNNKQLPFYFAAQNKNKEIFTLLLKANPNSALDDQHLNTFDLNSLFHLHVFLEDTSQ